MTKVLLSFSIFFTLLTFLGAAYVLKNAGQVNAGYAVVPMLFSLIFTTAWRNKKK